MKQKLHEDRKSFSKWAMPGQRTMPDAKAKIKARKIKSTAPWNVGKNNKVVA